MKTINIKGKDYVPVNERLKYFRENFKDYRLLSDLISNVDGVCVFKATIYDPQGNAVANGHSQEKENDTRSMVNKTSYIENSETSAWGRALGNFGIGIDASVASADEVANAIKEQGGEPPDAYQKTWATTQTINKNDLEEMVFECASKKEIIELWHLLVKKQQSDEEIKTWFDIRRQQLKDGGIYV